MLSHKSSVQDISDNSDMDQSFIKATESDHGKVVGKYDPWDSLMQKTF